MTTAIVRNDSTDVVFCRLKESGTSTFDQVLAGASLALAVGGLAALMPVAGGAIAGTALAKEIGFGVLSHVTAQGGALTALGGAFQVFVQAAEGRSAPLFPGDSLKRTSKPASDNDVEIIRTKVISESGRYYIEITSSTAERIGHGRTVADLLKSEGRLLLLQLPENQPYKLVSQKLLRFANININSSYQYEYTSANIPGGVFAIPTNIHPVVEYYNPLSTILADGVTEDKHAFSYGTDRHMELGLEHGWHGGNSYGIWYLSNGVSVLRLFDYKIHTTVSTEPLGSWDPNVSNRAIETIEGNLKADGKYYWAYWESGGANGHRVLFGIDGPNVNIRPSIGGDVYIVSVPEASLVYQRLELQSE